VKKRFDEILAAGGASVKLIEGYGLTETVTDSTAGVCRKILYSGRNFLLPGWVKWPAQNWKKKPLRKWPTENDLREADSRPKDKDCTSLSGKE
jgi:hypothetical protein